MLRPEDLAVVLDERRHLGQRHRQVAQRGRELLLLALEQVGHVGERLVEAAHGLVVLGQGADELAELLGAAEQLLLVVVQGGGQPGEVAERGAQVGALAVEVVGRDGEQVGQRAVAVGAVGAEGDVEGVEALVDLVELDRHRGLLDRELDVVGQHLAAGVGGGDLHVAVADDRRRHDGGLGVGRQLDVAVVGHGHHDVGARGRDRLDVADRHAEDAHLAALVDRDGPREVGDQPLGVGAGEHRERRRGHQGDDDERDGELPEEVHAQPTCGAGGRFWM